MAHSLGGAPTAGFVGAATIGLTARWMAHKEQFDGAWGDSSALRWVSDASQIRAMLGE
jgi:hypothetical protein